MKNDIKFQFEILHDVGNPAITEISIPPYPQESKFGPLYTILSNNTHRTWLTESKRRRANFHIRSDAIIQAARSVIRPMLATIN